MHRGALRIVDGRVDLQLLLDTSSLEVFAQGGEAILTNLILPPRAGAVKRVLRLYR